jgi:hypothetical protein
MTNHANQPAPPAKPAQAPPAAKPEDDAPVKYKRPLPKPGDKDYVVGQPVDDAEADKVEKEEAEKHAAAKKAKEEADKHAAAAAAPDKKGS